MHSFPKTGDTKKLKYVSVLYNSNELSADWITKEFQNPTILLSRKIKSSIQHNPVVTVCFIYASSDITSFQKDLFLKKHS